jgi:bifunctional DNase/RNase
MGIAVSVEDAQSLATQPFVTNSTRCQMYALLEACMQTFGFHINGVTVRIGKDGMTDTLLRLDGIATSAALPARLADGIALARRANVPIRMKQEDADRIRTSNSCAAGEDDTSSRPQGRGSMYPPRDPLQAFIETLNMDGLDESR